MFLNWKRTQTRLNKLSVYRNKYAFTLNAFSKLNSDYNIDVNAYHDDYADDYDDYDEHAAAADDTTYDYDDYDLDDDDDGHCITLIFLYTHLQKDSTIQAVMCM
ncbi:hypothetical protein DPMN_081872 [Dreissena polymorpha]|uniref:Uncharacterized protein n=1 Tax=Dreissena polymorpha TaxID=45954 RepID=A0A9D4BGQ7_DREPO|nr:hypothetical protein DPMN_081872 [Dreissena polymorpha]